MSETPEQFADRMVNKIFNGNKESDAVVKATEEPKPQPKTQSEKIDAMIKAYETPTAPDNLPLHEYVAKIQKEMEKP